jgi:hypothetical protein
VECDGCIVVRSSGDLAELVCNDCAMVVGTIKPERAERHAGARCGTGGVSAMRRQHLVPRADQLLP